MSAAIVETAPGRGRGVVVVHSPGGSRARSAAVPAEAEPRAAGLAPAQLVVEDEGVARAGDLERQPGDFGVVEAAHGAFIGEVANGAGRLAQLEALALEAAAGAAGVADLHPVFREAAVVLRASVRQRVHVVPWPLGHRLEVAQLGVHGGDCSAHALRAQAKCASALHARCA
jgi:hypothetical protein